MSGSTVISGDSSCSVTVEKDVSWNAGMLVITVSGVGVWVEFWSTVIDGNKFGELEGVFLFTIGNEELCQVSKISHPTKEYERINMISKV